MNPQEFLAVKEGIKPAMIITYCEGGSAPIKETKRFLRRLYFLIRREKFLKILDG